jgi:hypothetical protein
MNRSSLAKAALVTGATLSATATACSAHSHPQAARQAASPPVQRFHSRPDLKPPPVKLETAPHGAAPGLIFLAPKLAVAQAGPMIVDDGGHVVWFHPLDTKGVSDFRVQRFHGRPVLTWWRGRAPMGVGSGDYVVADTSYRTIATVRAGNGLAGDIHEFLITRRNTALFTVYRPLHVDLSPFGGPEQGRIFEGIIQEVAIPSGRVLFEWHSYPRVGLRESYVSPPPAAKGAKAAPWDYFHINSIEVEPTGTLLVSARNTHALYELDPKTGVIRWRLGGKRSDFALGPGVRFAWQHDARRRADGTITLFDNGATPPVEKFTRVLVLRLDAAHKRVALARSYVHPKRLLTPFEGNAQFLPDGHLLVGWGANPYFTEFDARGRVVLYAYFGHGKPPGKDADSYRVYKFVWHGRPTGPPALVVSHGTAYVSWNGATDVARWRLLVGNASDDLAAVFTVRRRGFETAIPIGSSGGRFVAVQALSAGNRILGTSKTLER